MDVAALVLWLITAVGGFTMAGIWLVNAGPAQYTDGHSRLSPARVGSHFAFAVLGLALWIVHVATDNTPTGWVALAVLPIVAVIGLLMVMTWLAGRGATTSVESAEQKFPALVVAAHGLFAVLTVLGVLAALLT